jgi:hypothetical protein
MEAEMMTCMTAGTTRIALAAAMLSAGLCGDAAATTHSGGLRARSAMLESHAEMAAPARTGAMRYYGGPKSPMWREVK